MFLSPKNIPSFLEKEKYEYIQQDLEIGKELPCDDRSSKENVSLFHIMTLAVPML
jgi:hypothetical protein